MRNGNKSSLAFATYPPTIFIEIVYVYIRKALREIQFKLSPFTSAKVVSVVQETHKARSYSYKNILSNRDHVQF